MRLSKYNVRKIINVLEKLGREKRDVETQDCIGFASGPRAILTVEYIHIHILTYSAIGGNGCSKVSGSGARSVAACFLPQRAASVLRIVGSSPERAFDISARPSPRSRN